MSGNQARRRPAPDAPASDPRIDGILQRLPHQSPRTEREPAEWLDEHFEPLAEPSSSTVDKSPLGEREQEILAFERKWWRHAGAKDQAIRDRFQLSATRYYQLLNALLDEPAALAHDPVLVQRLRRLRATRSRARGRR